MKNKINISLKSARDFLSDLDDKSRYLLASSVLILVSTGLIFIFIIPSIGNMANLSKGVIIEEGNLAYVIKYAKKINEIKASSKAVAAPQNPGEGQKGYIKSLYAMLAYFRINKNSIKKLTGSYSKNTQATEDSGSSESNGNGQGSRKGNSQAEKVSVQLRSITLNEVVDIIYGIYSSGFPVKFDSIKIRKNFNDKKLLDLDLELDRKISLFNQKTGKTNKNETNKIKKH